MRLITGMHRSGTSLVARLFFEAGADMGDPATLYPGDRWNPDGYFEQTDIHAINMPLIRGPFWKLAYFWLPSTRTILRRGERHGERIRRVAERYRGKVVKENRFCLTLPAWRAQGARVDAILLCLREPHAVAASLRRRNRITVTHGYRLWRVHNRRLLEAAGDLPLRLVRYRDLLDRDRFAHEAGGALRFFGLDPGAPELEKLRDLCVEPGYDHAPKRIAVTYPRAVESVWRELVERHADQDRAAALDPTL